LGLAEQRVQLILVGRTELPAAENPTLESLRTEMELRQELMRQAHAEGRRVRPVDIQSEIFDIVRNREIRANLNDFRKAGAKIDYLVADVRDEHQVKALLDGIYGRYGRLDGVVHGAGIIDDRLLVDKKMESVSRVFDTKVDSAYLLATNLRPESLKIMVFFTSVAGRYGNTGQTDYAAANELLNRFAWQLYRRWEGKVKVSSINWGPWESTRHGKGMVSPEAQRKFEKMGVTLVPPAPGRRFFMSEIVRAPYGQVEVIAGEGPWEAREAECGTFRSTNSDLAETMPEAGTQPLLGNVIKRAGPRGEVILPFRIDLERDRYLHHHLLDDIPVVPAAMALELIAEAAAVIWPGWIVNEISELRVLRGMQITDSTLDLEIVALASSHGDVSGFEASVMLRPVGGDARPFYRATVHLGTELLVSEAYRSTLRAQQTSVTMRQAYREWLFHGPSLQTITDLKRLDEQGALADVRPTRPVDLLKDSSGHGEWLFDPGVIDSAPQMAIVWAHAIRSASALPSRFGRVRRFGQGPLGPCRMHFLIHKEQDEHLVKADVAFVDNEQNLRLFIEELESPCSPALTRLDGGWKGEICI